MPYPFLDVLSCVLTRRELRVCFVTNIFGCCQLLKTICVGVHEPIKVDIQFIVRQCWATLKPFQILNKRWNKSPLL